MEVARNGSNAAADQPRTASVRPTDRRARQQANKRKLNQINLGDPIRTRARAR